MFSFVWKWINDRWPLSPVIRWSLDEEITGGPRFVYADGSAVLIVFLLQALTGVMQIFFYVPSVDHAYNSISFLRTEIPFGWLIHGLHYWGANLMIVLIALHMLRVFIWGAYKNPRQLTWLMGVALVLITMAFSMTGAPLHWDQRGYWAGEVGSSIAATTPVVGDLAKRMLRGGEEMGPLALSRFFVVHTAILPGSLLAIFMLHFISFRRFGSVGPWDQFKRKITGAFWPEQAFKDTIAGTAIFLFMIFLTAYYPPVYSGQADTLDTSYIPKAEWNFLFLYQALKYFEGPLEPVGTVGVPAFIVSLLVLLPFIDRNPEHDPFKRPFAMLCGLVFVGAILTLTLIGYYSPGFAQAPANGPSAQVRPLPAQTPAVAPAIKEIGPAAVAEKAPEKLAGPAAAVIGSAERGAMLFKNICSSCHGQAGTGKVPNPGSEEGKVPALAPIEKSIFNKDPRLFAENIDKYIQHGSVPEGQKPALTMPAFGDSNSLTQQEIANIEAYIMGLNNVDRAAIINPGIQPRLFFWLVSGLYVLFALIIMGNTRKNNDYIDDSAQGGTKKCRQ